MANIQRSQNKRVNHFVIGEIKYHKNGKAIYSVTCDCGRTTMMTSNKINRNFGCCHECPYFRGNARLFKYKGKNVTVKQFAAITGLPLSTAYRKLKQFQE
jgi:hypothetical protein